MRAIIQRAMKASVTVGDELISSIDRGVCVLIGISRDDTEREVEYLVRKILNLKIFDDDNGKRWCKSVLDKQYEVLCVSQFTLYCTLKGNKPDYHLSMGGEQSEIFYHNFLDELRKAYRADKIKDGKFGEYMQVQIQNDGPVTIPIDTPPYENLPAKKPDRRPQKQKPLKCNETETSSNNETPNDKNEEETLVQQVESKLTT